MYLLCRQGKKREKPSQLVFFFLRAAYYLDYFHALCDLDVFFRLSLRLSDDRPLFYKTFLRTSAVSSTNLRSILIFCKLRCWYLEHNNMIWVSFFLQWKGSYFILFFYALISSPHFFFMHFAISMSFCVYPCGYQTIVYSSSSSLLVVGNN